MRPAVAIVATRLAAFAYNGDLGEISNSEILVYSGDLGSIPKAASRGDDVATDEQYLYTRSFFANFNQSMQINDLITYGA
jgi:hypothetical protein